MRHGVTSGVSCETSSNKYVTLHIRRQYDPKGLCRQRSRRLRSLARFLTPLRSSPFPAIPPVGTFFLRRPHVLMSVQRLCASYQMCRFQLTAALNPARRCGALRKNRGGGRCRATLAARASGLALSARYIYIYIYRERERYRERKREREIDR